MRFHSYDESGLRIDYPRGATSQHQALNIGSCFRVQTSQETARSSEQCHDRLARTGGQGGSIRAKAGFWRDAEGVKQSRCEVLR